MKSRLAVAGGVFIILLVLLVVAPRVGMEGRLYDLALGVTLGWGGQIVTFFFRKKEAG